MRKYGFSFSWKRLLGISGLKTKISRKTGIPLTKSGFERKVGRTVIKTIEKAVTGQIDKGNKTNKNNRNKINDYSDRDNFDTREFK